MKTLKLALAAALTLPAMSVFAEEEALLQTTAYLTIWLITVNIFSVATHKHTMILPYQGGVDYEHSSGLLSRVHGCQTLAWIQQMAVLQASLKAVVTH
jgi:hypothetical protein